MKNLENDGLNKSNLEVQSESPKAKALSSKVNRWQFFRELPGADTGKYQVVLEMTSLSEKKEMVVYYAAYHCASHADALGAVLAIHPELPGWCEVAVYVEGTCPDCGEYSYQGRNLNS